MLIKVHGAISKKAWLFNTKYIVSIQPCNNDDKFHKDTKSLLSFSPQEFESGYRFEALESVEEIYSQTS